MVALSVSISANTSPFLTASPTFFCHPAITPSVMVSLKRGIKTISSLFNTSEFAAVGVAGVGAEAVVVVAAAGSLLVAAVTLADVLVC